ncbi:MAG: helix-turn-helix transcriptional regulator, partial [Lachnospiraceae bacterium]|nr:helix-turn-helix transcriptional regulator [Lachnospiraceae bacterium]
MTTEEMKDRKTALGLTNEMIAEAADIPLSTVQKIMSGATKAPRKATLVAIEAVLREEERRRREPPEPAPGRNHTYDYVPEEKGSVEESAPAYASPPAAEKKDGDYTLDDYYALPDERRVE